MSKGKARFSHVTTDAWGTYTTVYRVVYRTFGVSVPYWLWRFIPSRFRAMELA